MSCLDRIADACNFTAWQNEEQQMKISTDRKKIQYYMDLYRLYDMMPEGLHEHARLFSFEKGELICALGAEVSQLFFFVEGKAKIYTQLENGRKHLLRFYYPLQILGDMEVMNVQPYKVFAEALSSCNCIGIPMSIVRSQGTKDARFMGCLCRHLSEKLDSLSQKASRNLLYPLESRLASYLIESLAAGTDTVEITSSLSDLAELLGSSYRHLNRVIIQMEDAGLMEKSGHRFKIRDKKALETLSDAFYT